MDQPIIINIGTINITVIICDDENNKPHPIVITLPATNIS